MVDAGFVLEDVENVCIQETVKEGKGRNILEEKNCILLFVILV